jgi:hypothetical protein
MGSRSRKRRVPAAERDAAIRESLEPLAPGERPKAVTVAAVVAALIGAANLVLLAAGYDVRGKEQPSTGGAIVFALVMFVAAGAMWQAKYWAVLGFQCLLAVICLYAGLSLLLAEDVFAVVLCLALIVSSGTLFWFLIRAMARIQMPERPGSPSQSR